MKPETSDAPLGRVTYPGWSMFVGSTIAGTLGLYVVLGWVMSYTGITLAATMIIGCALLGWMFWDDYAPRTWTMFDGGISIKSKAGSGYYLLDNILEISLGSWPKAGVTLNVQWAGQVHRLPLNSVTEGFVVSFLNHIERTGRGRLISRDPETQKRIRALRFGSSEPR